MFFHLSLLYIFLVLPYLASMRVVADPNKVQGQAQVNVLRHTVAVSGLPSQFGKHGHILLSRTVVPPSDIWEAADSYTKEILSHPHRLDWYVADYSTDGRRTVTINGGFSCLDVGNSTGLPLLWWASEGFSELTNREAGIGGAEVKEAPRVDNEHDITTSCFNARNFDRTNLRLVEHSDLHRGAGVLFKEENDPPTSVVGDNSIFRRLEEMRSEDQETEVLFDPSTLQVSLGLTFDTGMRLRVPPGFTTEQTLALRVPITPLSALTKHSGARLEEARVAEGQTSTDSSVLIWTVFSTGLPLLLALWFSFQFIFDTIVAHSLESRERPTQDAVNRIVKWKSHQILFIIANLIGVVIFAAPFALAVAEGKLDPRKSYEVTTGATVLYGSSKEALSSDPQNPIAGAPFFVTVWITVRHLDDGFVAALLGSLLLIVVLAISIPLVLSKRSSEMMPGSKSRWKFWRGICVRKFFGSLWLRISSLRRSVEKTFTVLIELYDGAVDNIPLEEVLLMQAYGMRKRSNVKLWREAHRNQDEWVKRQGRDSLQDEFSRYGRRRYRLLCRVKMDNKVRYDASMSQSWIFDSRLPREWEYVRRSRKCEAMEWYRANGKMPPDDALIFARLGLLPYMQHIKKVVIKKENGIDEERYDADGVKTIVIVTPTDSQLEEEEVRYDFPKGRVLDNWDDLPEVFIEEVATDLVDGNWHSGSLECMVKCGKEKLDIRYVVIDEDVAEDLCYTECGAPAVYLPIPPIESLTTAQERATFRTVRDKLKELQQRAAASLQLNEVVRAMDWIAWRPRSSRKHKEKDEDKCE